MSDRRLRIADAARSHAGCSALLHPEVYEDLVVRPVDRVAPARTYYYANPGPSTCALAAVGALRLAGCVEPECVAPYLPAGQPIRNAVVDIQRLGYRSAAWMPAGASPMRAPGMGDIWIITNDSGGDAHVGVCVSDPVVGADGAIVIETVEGGQWDGRGSTAVQLFTRTFYRQGTRLRMGTRYVFGYAIADRMPIPEMSGAV